jgi:hypothetical protein
MAHAREYNRHAELGSASINTQANQYLWSQWILKQVQDDNWGLRSTTPKEE